MKKSTKNQHSAVDRNKCIEVCLYAVITLYVASITGCGCLLGGGGDTARAERLPHTHKEVGIGIGGPGWWLLKHLGARLIEDETPVAALAIKGVRHVQVSSFVLEDPSEAHHQEILNLYGDLLRQKQWHLITRVDEVAHTSCVYAQYDEERFRGVFVVAIEAHEMHVIKISGDIRPEVFAELNASLGHYGARLPIGK